MLTPEHLQIHQKRRTTKLRAQAFTTLSAAVCRKAAFHYRVLLLSSTKLVGLFIRKARAAKQFDSKKIRLLPSYPPSPCHSSLQTLHSCDPRENGLTVRPVTTGLQSRPPKLLEQPPTRHYIWCLHWLFLLLFFWLLYLSFHLWRWYHALDLKARHLLCH